MASNGENTPTFRQTPSAADGGQARENTPVFPCGTIFRASGPNGSRVTALVKSDGRIKVLRSNNFTWKSPDWAPGYVENKSCDEFVAIYAKESWTLTADVKPPRDWWYEADTEWRRVISLGAPHAEIVRVTQAAYAKAREGWAEYVRRLQALYPIFKTIEKAPEGTNVPLRMSTTANQPQQPALLTPPPRTTEYERQQTETITLTREQLNFIYTMLSGRAMTDDQWDQARQMTTAV